MRKKSLVKFRKPRPSKIHHIDHPYTAKSASPSVSESKSKLKSISKCQDIRDLLCEDNKDNKDNGYMMDGSDRTREK